MLCGVPRYHKRVWQNMAPRPLLQNYKHIFPSILYKISIIFNGNTLWSEIQRRNHNLKENWSRCSASRVLWPGLHLIYTSNVPTSGNKTNATFADETAIWATHEDTATTSAYYIHSTQTNLTMQICHVALLRKKKLNNPTRIFIECRYGQSTSKSIETTSA
jgi:hypothetical protein